MLARAWEGYPNNVWTKVDLHNLKPAELADVLFSNAVFQWINSHKALLCRPSHVTVGGVLAFQLPRNWDAPSHRMLHELVAKSRHRKRLEPSLLHNPVGSPESYYGLLSTHVDHLDIWETEYLHVLGGKSAVASWVLGSALAPLLDLLD